MSSHRKSFSSYWDIYRAVQRQWRQASVSFLVFMGLIVMAILFWPRSYVSEGKLFVRQTVKHIAQDPSATKGQAVYMQQSRQLEINSIVELLRSQALAEKVVDEIGWEVILDGSRSGGADNPAKREKAIRHLMNSLEVTAPRDSTVIDIRCKSPDAELSQRIVDTLMIEYLDEHLRVNRTDRSYRFFEEQTGLLKDKLQLALDELREAKDKLQLLSIEGKRNSLQEQLHSIEMATILTERELSTSQAKVQALARTIAELPERLTTEQVNGIASQASDAMRNELYKLEAEEQRLAAAYTDEHPEVIAVRKQIAELREIFSRQQKERVQVTTAPNLNRQQLELALLNETAQLSTAQSQLNKLNEQHERLVQRLESLNAADVHVASLQQAVDIARTNYQAYADKLEQSRMHQEMETDRISNVKIAQDATLRRKPASPRKGMIFLLGLFVSGVASLAIALFLESQDESLKSRDEIEEQLRLPVLLSIPRVSDQQVLQN